MRSTKRMNVLVLVTGLAMLTLARPAEATFSPAKKRAKAGLCRSKFGPKTIKKTKYGRAFWNAWDKACWSCPAGYARTINPNVRAPKACQKKGQIRFARTKKHRKVKFLGKCPRGQFLHVFNQTCYSCPKGFRRSPDPRVGGAKACVRKTKDRWARGMYRGRPKRFCPKGAFFDPRNGGECWSCPKGWHRTVNPVTSAKACSKKLLGVLSIDIGLCKNVVGALRKSTKGVDDLRSAIDGVLRPLRKPVEQAMKKALSRLDSPKEVDRFIRNVAASMKPYSPVVDEVTRVGQIMDAKPSRFANILLNPSLICSGNKRRINQALRRAGINPDFEARRAGFFDGLFVRRAYAAGGDTFHVLSFSATSIAPKYQVGTALTLSIVTNFGRHFGVFVSAPAAAASTSPGVEASVGYMLFPRASWDQFSGINQLGIELGFSAGETTEQLLDALGKKKLLKAILNGALFFDYAVSFEPEFITQPNQSIPGFGASKTFSLDDAKKDKAAPGGGPRKPKANPFREVVGLSASVDYSHQLGR